MCVKADEEVFERKNAENISTFTPFPSPMLSGMLGTVSFHITLECLTVAESFTRLFLSSCGSQCRHRWIYGGSGGSSLRCGPADGASRPSDFTPGHR